MMKLKCFSQRLGILAIATMVFCVAGCENWTEDSGGGGGIGNQGEGGGFLWKPVSDSTGRLAIHLPVQYRGQVAAMFVADANKNRVEAGVFSGYGNPNRPLYRFSRQGGAYGNNVYAVADLNDGNTVHWPIPVGSRRTEY